MTVQVIKQFEISTPPGTSQASPLVTQCQLDIFTVMWIELEVPSGPRGALGFYLASSNQQIIPFRAGATPNWLVWDDMQKHWDVVDQPDSGDWQTYSYNTGTLTHVFYVRFGLVVPSPDTASPVPDPVPLG